MRPLLLLDVDGVLNPAPPPSGPIGGWSDWQPLPDHARPTSGLPGWWSRQQGAAVSALGCAVVWATTWEAEANATYARLFGWSERPVIRWLPSKAETVPAYLHARAAHRTLPPLVVWIDDELRAGGHLADDARVDAALTELPTEVLRVGPATSEGLTTGDVRAIAEWLDGPKGA